MGLMRSFFVFFILIFVQLSGYANSSNSNIEHSILELINDNTIENDDKTRRINKLLEIGIDPSIEFSTLNKISEEMDHSILSPLSKFNIINAFWHKFYKSNIKKDYRKDHYGMLVENYHFNSLLINENFLYDLSHDFYTTKIINFDFDSPHFIDKFTAENIILLNNILTSFKKLSETSQNNKIMARLSLSIIRLMQKLPDLFLDQLKLIEINLEFDHEINSIERKMLLFIARKSLPLNNEFEGFKNLLQQTLTDEELLKLPNLSQKIIETPLPIIDFSKITNKKAIRDEIKKELAEKGILNPSEKFWLSYNLAQSYPGDQFFKLHAKYIDFIKDNILLNCDDINLSEKMKDNIQNTIEDLSKIEKHLMLNKYETPHSDLALEFYMERVLQNDLPPGILPTVIDKLMEAGEERLYNFLNQNNDHFSSFCNSLITSSKLYLSEEIEAFLVRSYYKYEIQLSNEILMNFTGLFNKRFSTTSLDDSNKIRIALTLVENYGEKLLDMGTENRNVLINRIDILSSYLIQKYYSRDVLFPNRKNFFDTLLYLTHMGEITFQRSFYSKLIKENLSRNNSQLVANVYLNSFDSYGEIKRNKLRHSFMREIIFNSPSDEITWTKEKLKEIISAKNGNKTSLEISNLFKKVLELNPNCYKTTVNPFSLTGETENLRPAPPLKKTPTLNPAPPHIQQDIPLKNKRQMKEKIPAKKLSQTKKNVNKKKRPQTKINVSKKKVDELSTKKGTSQKPNTQNNPQGNIESKIETNWFHHNNKNEGWKSVGENEKKKKTSSLDNINFNTFIHADLTKDDFGLNASKIIELLMSYVTEGHREKRDKGRPHKLVRNLDGYIAMDISRYHGDRVIFSIHGNDVHILSVNGHYPQEIYERVKNPDFREIDLKNFIK